MILLSILYAHFLEKTFTAPKTAESSKRVSSAIHSLGTVSNRLETLDSIRNAKIGQNYPNSKSGNKVETNAQHSGNMKKLDIIYIFYYICQFATLLLYALGKKKI